VFFRPSFDDFPRPTTVVALDVERQDVPPRRAEKHEVEPVRQKLLVIADLALAQLTQAGHVERKQVHLYAARRSLRNLKERRA